MSFMPRLSFRSFAIHQQNKYKNTLFTLYLLGKQIRFPNVWRVVAKYMESPTILLFSNDDQNRARLLEPILHQTIINYRKHHLLPEKPFTLSIHQVQNLYMKDEIGDTEKHHLICDYTMFGIGYILRGQHCLDCLMWKWTMTNDPNSLKQIKEYKRLHRKRLRKKRATIISKLVELTKQANVAQYNIYAVLILDKDTLACQIRETHKKLKHIDEQLYGYRNLSECDGWVY